MGLAVDFEREERSQMAITSLWPAAVGPRSIMTLDCAYKI